MKYIGYIANSVALACTVVNAVHDPHPVSIGIAVFIGGVWLLCLIELTIDLIRLRLPRTSQAVQVYLCDGGVQIQGHESANVN